MFLGGGGKLSLRAIGMHGLRMMMGFVRFRGVGDEEGIG
jgi:hypothetical protein